MSLILSNQCKSRLLVICFIVGIGLTGCATSKVDVGALSRTYMSLEETNAKDVKVHFNDLPKVGYQVVGRLEIIGFNHRNMQKGLKKETAKIGGDAAVVIGQHQSSSDYFSPGHKISEIPMGTKDGMSYSLVTFRTPHRASAHYTRWFAYAVSFKEHSVSATEVPVTLFDYEKDKIFDAMKRKILAEKRLDKYKDDPLKTKMLQGKIDEAKLDLNKLRFDSLSDFDKKAVIFKGAHLAGVQIEDHSPEGEKRIKLSKTLGTVGSVLSYS